MILDIDIAVSSSFPSVLVIILASNALLTRPAEDASVRTVEDTLGDAHTNCEA